MSDTPALTRTVTGHRSLGSNVMLHAGDPGLTLPTPAPHIRIDYVFVPSLFADRVVACDVVRHPQAAAASDHYPVVVDLAVNGGL